MNATAAALWTELMKVRRSRVPLLTALGFALAPLVGAFFMIVLKDPEQARRLGLISAKAQLVAGVADWPTYFSLVAQAVSVGGLLVFAIVVAWVFGREFSDHTIKNLLALPTPRGTIVAAKLVVVVGWLLLLVLMVAVLALVLGYLVGLPGWSSAIGRAGLARIGWCGLLTATVSIPVAFFASLGRGYLVPLGWALFTVFLAQIVAAAGWGSVFPWSIPALASGMGGAETPPTMPGYALVAATGLAGAITTLLFWYRADFTH